MSETNYCGHRIATGQRWRSKDKRDNGQTIDLIRVPSSPDGVTYSGNLTVTAMRLRKTTMTLHTLINRYELVSDVPPASSAVPAAQGAENDGDRA